MIRNRPQPMHQTLQRLIDAASARGLGVFENRRSKSVQSKRTEASIKNPKSWPRSL